MKTIGYSIWKEHVTVQVLDAMSSSSKFYPVLQLAVSSNHFSVIFLWTRVHIIPPHIFLESFTL